MLSVPVKLGEPQVRAHQAGFPQAFHLTSMEAEMQRGLPLEIYDHIVHQLRNDPPSLKQCSLVCRRFSYQSQQHLFRRVLLHRPYRIPEDHIISVHHPAERFLKVIIQSPRLCEFVKELEISDADNRSYYRERKSWIREDRAVAVARILPMLYALEELIIEGNERGSRLNFLSWNAELQSAILLKVLSLRRLSLSLIEVPLTLLFDTPRLESLSLRQVHFGPSQLPGERMDHKKSETLKRFEIISFYYGDWLSLYPWLQSGESCSIDTTQLIDVTLLIDVPLQLPYEYLHSISWLLQGCAKNLEHLRLHYSEAVLTSPFHGDSFVDLISMPLLESLHISGCIWGNWDLLRDSRDQNRLQVLTNNLAKISLNNVLKKVHLEFEIEDFEEIRNSGFEAAGWEDFCRVIGNLANTVANVSVRLVVYYPMTRSRSTQDFLQRVMQPLSQRANVVVCSDDDHIQTIDSDGS